jgi:ElaB/YqjD/DUF883 family membrane-anchored ribosome-binding protein
MDMTIGSAGTQTRHGAGRPQGEIDADAHPLQDAAAATIQELMKDVDTLVSRVADIKDPQIENLRAKVQQALSGARAALSQGTHSLRDRGGRATDATLDFVRENPWKSLGIASLVGIAVAVLAARRD